MNRFNATDAVDSQHRLGATGRTQIVEQSPSRLVLFLVPTFGVQSVVALVAVAGGAAVAAYVWTKVFTEARQPPGWPAIVLCALNGLLFVIFVMFLILIRFTRFHLVIEAERLILTRLRFGHSQTTELALNLHAQASLIKVARQNGRPIHAIKIKGTDRSIRFAVGLAEEDKRWVVEAVNACLQSRAAADCS